MSVESKINNKAEGYIDKIKESCTTIEPLLVIRCITYNQESYIRDTLEGFISQKTTFRFVAIVHDDASTDGTSKIVKEYADKYPDIIKPIYETENQYSKRDGSLGRIMNAACESTGAKYIAMCEGDDYWIEPLKLQKQVNYLEAHPEYSLCFHSVKVIREKGSNASISSFSHLIEKDYSGIEIMQKWTIPTCSVVFRKEVLYSVPVNKNFTQGDNVLWLTASLKGKLHCINEKWGVYRRQPTGWTSQSVEYNTQRHIKHLKALKESFPEYEKTGIFDAKIFEFLYLWFCFSVKFKPKSLCNIYYLGIKEFGWRFNFKLIKTLIINFYNKLR